MRCRRHTALRRRSAQRNDIRTRGVLKDPQPEFRNHGQHMVENIRLYPLVIHPDDRIGQEIELHRKPRFRRLQLAHHQRHRLVHRHLVLQVAHQIGPENPEVGLMQAVDPPFGGPDAVRGVVGFDPPLGLLDIVLDEVDGAVMDRTYPIKTKPGDAVKVVGGNLYKLSVTIGNASEDIDFVIEDWIPNTLSVGDIFGEPVK